MVEEAETQDTSEVEVEQSHFTTPPTSPAGKQGWREKLKIHKFKILAGILGILVFAGAVFGAYKLGTRQTQPTPTPMPAVVVTPTPDLTSDWKTYTNTKYGYSIKYPSDWVLQPDKQAPDEIVNFGKDLYGLSIYAGGASTGVPPGAIPSEISSVTIGGKEATREVFEGLKILIKFSEELDEVNQIVASVEHSDTLNLVLSTFRFLEEEISWVRKKFDEAWNIEYPVGWTVDERGLIEGWITLEGEYKGDSYEVTMGYPITLGYGDEPPPDITLQKWVDHELSFLSLSQRANLRIADIIVAGAAAKKTLNLPEKIYDDSKTRRYSEKLTHMVYIWRRGGKSPSTITIKQTSGTFDSEKMVTLLDRFVGGIK